MERKGLKNKISAFMLMLVFPILFLCSQICASVVYTISLGFSSAVNGNQDLMNSFTANMEDLPLIVSAASGILTSIIIIIWAGVAGKKRKDTIALVRPNWKQILLCVLIGIGLYIFTSLFLSLIPLPESWIEDYEQMTESALTSQSLGLTIFAIAIVAPITEELVFRGACIYELKKGFGMAAVIIIQGIVFACCHLIPLQIVYVLPVAMFLGIVMHLTGSIYCTITVHAVYNLIGSIISYISEDSLESTIALVCEIGLLAVSAVALVLLGIIRQKSTQKKNTLIH